MPNSEPVFLPLSTAPKLIMFLTQFPYTTVLRLIRIEYKVETKLTNVRIE